MLDSKSVLILIEIDKPLKSVEVAPILADECPGVPSGVDHFWHLVPFMVEYVKFFACLDHGVILIASSDYVYKPVFKVVVCCKTCSTLANGWQLLNLVGSEMELEAVGNGGCHLLVNVISRDDNDSVIWNVNCPPVLKLLVKAMFLLILGVSRHFNLPLALSLGALLSLLTNVTNFA
jgi:hypothetical protein